MRSPLRMFFTIQAVKMGAPINCCSNIWNKLIRLAYEGHTEQANIYKQRLCEGIDAILSDGAAKFDCLNAAKRSEFRNFVADPREYSLLMSTSSS